MITQEQKSYEESNKKKQKVSAFLVNENKSQFFFVLFIFIKEKQKTLTKNLEQYPLTFF